MNKQKNLLVKCPPLKLNNGNRSISSASHSRRSRKRGDNSSFNGSSKASTLVSVAVPPPTYRPEGRNRKATQRKLGKSHSNKFDQLRNDRSLVDDGSMVSEVSGMFTCDQSSLVYDPVKEKRDAMLMQTIFADRNGKETQNDSERHSVEVKLAMLIC